MLAFLNKADRPELTRPVHIGWTSALAAGVPTWWVATSLISVSGASRELTEGFGSLLAAAVLLFVGIWMHGKAQAGQWQRYIREKLHNALASDSRWFLFSLAFIAVYREVFETILFFTAMAAEGAVANLIAGAIAGFAALAAIAVAMLRFSRRLPIGKFFTYSSALVAVLAVVLAGKGVAALQEAGLIAIHPLAGFPRISVLGIFPTLQGILAQVATLLALLHRVRRQSPVIAAIGTRLIYSVAVHLRRGERNGGREQGDPGRQSGRGSGGAFAPKRRRGREPASRDVGELERQSDRRAQGKDRVAQVTIFNENLGKVAKNYLRKGSKVYLEGQLQTRKWTDQAGQERYSTEIVLQNYRGELQLLDSREGGGGSSRGAFNEDFGGRRFRRRRAVTRPSRGRSRRRSTPIWTTTFPFRSFVGLPEIGEHRERARLSLGHDADLLERGLGARASRIGIEAERERIGDRSAEIDHRAIVEHHVAVGFAELDFLIRSVRGGLGHEHEIERLVDMRGDRVAGDDAALGQRRGEASLGADDIAAARQDRVGDEPVDRIESEPCGDRVRALHRRR